MVQIVILHIFVKQRAEKPFNQKLMKPYFRFDSEKVGIVLSDTNLHLQRTRAEVSVYNLSE